MSAPSPIPGKILGHYRIEEQIGLGGMGVVYRAHDEQLGRDVAIKGIPPGALADEVARKRFRKEALALGRLNHPNIAMAFEFGSDEGVDYLVTEYIPGINLDDKIGGRALPERTVIEYGLQLARGLEAAHRENVIHRDLKPGNIRIHRDGQLKILDFGLAHLHEPETPEEDTASITEQKLGAGTLPYMAPEQVRGQPGDRRSDIWATGAILYEMATGHRAFPMAVGLAMIDAIQHSDPVRPSRINPEVSPTLEAIIVKALDKDPDRRYQSARELSVDLLRLLPPSQPSTAALALPKPKRRFPMLPIVLTAVLAIGIAAGILWRSHTNTPAAPTQRVLAVLPFDSSGQDPKTAALVLGLTQTLTARLAQVSSDSLQLISSRDVQAQGVKTADEAWREFHADLVVEGDAHEMGNQIRVNCALVDPQTHRQLGARTITVASRDVFGLEDQVVREVAEILSTQGSGPAVAIAARAESSPEAYASYLRARGYLQEYQKPENIDHAIDELQDAVQVDPHFAEAYAGLGKAYLLGYQELNRGNEWVKKAAENCEISLSSKDTSEGEICAGSVANQTGKYGSAVGHFRRALALEPGSEEALRGLAGGYESLGRLSDAEATYQRAISARPRYWGVYNWLGVFYFRQARYADAIAMFQKVVELAPDNYRGFSNIGGVYVNAGRYNEAIAPLQRSIQIRPNLEAYTNLGTAYFYLRRFSESADTFNSGLKVGDSDWMLWGDYGDALYWSGNRREESGNVYRHAIAMVEKRLAVNPKDARAIAYQADYYAMLGSKAKALDLAEFALELSPKDSEVLFRSAIVYNHFSDTERALEMLERAVENGYAAQVIRDTPDFDGLQSNPRYRTLLKFK